MTFLELVQDLRRECGVSASTAGDQPSAVTNQTGEMLRLVNWTRRAWLKIQNDQDWWLWMRQDFTLAATANVGSYAPTVAIDDGTSVAIARFARWHPRSFRLYDAAVGVADEQFLVDWDYDKFRDSYLYAGQRNQRNRPVVWAERPNDKAILLGDVPDKAYTLRGCFQRGPQTLSANADVPEMPERFHPLIVYKAMQYYGKYEAAPEILAQGQEEYSAMMDDLVRDQLPPLEMGLPLA